MHWLDSPWEQGDRARLAWYINLTLTLTLTLALTLALILAPTNRNVEVWPQSPMTQARPGEGPDPALVERVKAGQEPKKKQLYKREREGLYIRKKIGCSLSHMRVLLQSLVHGWPLTMVLEDDAELSPDFFPQLQQVLCKLPRDWDVLFLVRESLPIP